MKDSHMFSALKKGLETGEKKGADYVELRAEETHLTLISYADGRVDNLISKMRTGLACRVLYHGAWGFTCGRMDDAGTLVAEACSLARATSQNRKEEITLADITPSEENTHKHYRIPPHEVSFEDKISRLDTLYDRIRNHDERIKAVSIKYSDSHGKKYLTTNEGTAITQETGHVWNYCWVTGKENGTLTAARDEVGSSEEGYEFFEKQSAGTIADRIGKRVVLQLRGKTPKKGHFPCVLGPRVVGVLAHEALGHLAEADLTLNSSFNGKLGEKVASEMVTMVDAPLEGTFGGQKYDDEGVKMARVDIIKEGIFSGILTDREYASKTQMPACGAARAESFLFPTLIRMRNTFFEPGDCTDEDLFEGIDFGYYCVDFRGGQAQLNSSFQVGIQEGFEINDGEIGDPIKDLSISGVATDALFLIEGVGKQLGFEEGRCGKDQIAYISAGGPHIRVKKGGILFGGRE
jgi:TldD protein